MKLLFATSALLIIVPLSGMKKARALLEEYPKTSGFLAGAFATASVVEAYHLWKKDSMPVISRDLIVSCLHESREKPRGELEHIKKHTECHDLVLEYVNSISYKNPLSGTTEIYEEDRKDIRIILNKLSPEWRGSPETELLQSNGTLSLAFQDNIETRFDKVNCKIYLPRNQRLAITVVGAGGGSLHNKETILYRKR